MTGDRTVRIPLVLLAVCGSAATMFMAITNVLAGAPQIGEALRADQSDIQWIADCYPLVLATLLLPAGVLADRFGRRRLLAVGLGLLAAGLAGASQAGSVGTLVASLAVAGLGAGLGFPSTLATVTGAIPPQQRRLGVSLWAAAVPVGGLAGALVSGVVMEFASWSPPFLVTAGFALACLALTAAFVPETRDPAHGDLDIPGAVLSALAVACLVIGLTRGPVDGWASAGTLGPLAGSALLLWAFVAFELRTPRPLLDVRLFRVRAFSAAAAAMFLMFGGMYGVVFLSYQWETYVLGYSTLRTGVGLMPFAILMLPLAPAGTTLAARFGLKPVMAAAMACGVVGSLLLATAGTTENYWSIALGCFVMGGCIGLAAGPGTDAISSPLPPARQGVASAVNDLTRELGATLGIAVAGTAFNAGYRADVSDHLAAAPGPAGDAVRASPAAGMEAAAHAGPAGRHYADVVVGATNAGWTVALLTVTGAFAIGLVLLLRWFPRTQTGALDAPAETEPARAM